MTIFASYSRSSSPEQGTSEAVLAGDPRALPEELPDHKLIIYQIFTRLFGNKNTSNKIFGTIDENGVGKFADISDLALQELKQMRVSHVWYTGVLEHATMTDYTAYGIPQDDADVIKGRAGSPYAIKDYYDVNPDLAVQVPNRVQEFEELVQRTHANGLNVLIDFVPNHVARRYISDAKPPGVEDLGARDNNQVAFEPNNNYYYLPGQHFVVPPGHVPLGSYDKGPQEDGQFNEFPAKATGNDVFSPAPSVHDWFETVKLNYGVDYLNHRQTHFDPIPSTWLKMRDILVHWAGKNVDGFRCDMAEMVPVEFWAWVIPEVKRVNPDIIFIAEIYNPQQYHNYIHTGCFDYLYDKVGLYDGLRRLMEGRGHSTTEEITRSWREETRGIGARMLRFLENHDEQRIASSFFAGNPWSAVPAMTVTATLASGPVMVYFGQEVGEPGQGQAGFSGEDGRTTIFDYWGLPEHQKWMNGGQFDGGQLSEEQKRLRAFYSRLLNVTASNEAIRQGRFYELPFGQANGRDQGYAYLRYTPNQRLLIAVNFDRYNTLHTAIEVPVNAWQAMGLGLTERITLTDLLSSCPTLSLAMEGGSDRGQQGALLPLELPPLSAFIFELKK
jgi:glycosidase